MWYSFLGAVLTVLLGITISTITEKMTKSKVQLMLENNIEKQNATDEKPNRINEMQIFTVETYRKTSQINQIPLHGFDNEALKIEDETKP